MLRKRRKKSDSTFFKMEPDWREGMSLLVNLMTLPPHGAASFFFACAKAPTAAFAFFGKHRYNKAFLKKGKGRKRPKERKSIRKEPEE